MILGWIKSESLSVTLYTMSASLDINWRFLIHIGITSAEIDEKTLRKDQVSYENDACYYKSTNELELHVS